MANDETLHRSVYAIGQKVNRSRAAIEAIRSRRVASFVLRHSSWARSDPVEQRVPSDVTEFA